MGANEVFVPEKSIFERFTGSIAAAFFSLVVALVTLLLSIGALFFSMRAMRERQTGNAFQQRIEQEENSRLSADLTNKQDSSQPHADQALRNAEVTASAVPLLRKEVESLQEREKIDASAIRNQNDRLDGFAEWYSALIVGTIVSIMSLGATVIGIAFKYRKDSLQTAVSSNDFT
jgi:hypothetical protein